MIERRAMGVFQDPLLGAMDVTPNPAHPSSDQRPPQSTSSAVDGGVVSRQAPQSVMGMVYYPPYHGRHHH